MPTNQQIVIHPILEEIARLLPGDKPLYVVGGAVRNALAGLEVKDIDFSMPGGAIDFSRRVADSFGGDFYVLDVDRDYGRVILKQVDGSRLVLDFAAFQGTNLDQDLEQRDFTVNAMAVDVQRPQEIFDPLGGANDLYAKKLRVCTSNSFTADPVRVLRAIRFSIGFNLKATAETKHLMSEAVPLLSGVTAERLRDEILQLLGSKKPAAAIRALDYLDALPFIFPELPPLKGLIQTPPHIMDAWDHSLDVLNRLKDVLAVLRPGYDPETTTSLYLGVISHRLGRFRPQLEDHLALRLNINRSLSPLLFFAALYHDAGKPGTKEIDQDGRTRFIEHEIIGADLIAERARAYQLSNNEVFRLKTIVRNHMRPLWLSQTGKPPSRRAIYRFYKDCGVAGIDVCLLSLADTMATYGPGLPSDQWSQQVEVVRSLFDSWWEDQDQIINPPALVNGDDLINELGLKPGPLIGHLLAEIREAQAEGELQNKRQAIEFASDKLTKPRTGNTKKG